METVRCIRAKSSGWIEPSGGRMILHFSAVHDARGTWHVPPGKDLKNIVRVPTGQTGDTADPNPAGHSCTTPTCVLLWLPCLWVAACTHQGRNI